MSSGARGFFHRLYRGETNIDFIGQRRRWYVASLIIIVICLTSIIFRGFNYGIEFAGGNQFEVPVKAGTSLSAVRGAVAKDATVASAQVAGTGARARYVIRTEPLSDSKVDQVRTDLTTAAKVGASDVNATKVSSSWGRDVTKQAVIGLIVFLFLVALYLWIRYERKMALAAILALAHDLILTAGVYSIVGFEVTPATVIGLLTILGFSLYDTVVVFDKVDENARGILAGSRMTYADAANLAVNQTLMRSINTSIIALLPVAGLLFVGAGVLGVGTLEDLALVLFVGMLTGAYSSLFLATPWLVDFKMMEPRYKAHAQRVAAKRAALANAEKQKVREPVPAGDAAEEHDLEGTESAALAGAAPRPGQRPAGQQRKRPAGRPAGGGPTKRRR